MSSYTCSLCGLRYPAQSLLELHIREDHAQRADQPAAPAAVPVPDPDPAPAPAPQLPRRRGSGSAGPKPPGAP